MENLPNEVLLVIYERVDFMDLISLEQVSRQLYETIRSMVWPRVSTIGWQTGHLLWDLKSKVRTLQKVGDPNKLVAILKRVGSRVDFFEFNFVKYTAQDLDYSEEETGIQLTEYEYSLPSMFSLLNPSCMVDLFLEGTPIQSKELILIANTFKQLRKVGFSWGSLSCAAEEKQTMTESFSIFLEKFSSYGRLEYLSIANTFDSTHLNFEHIPPSLEWLDLIGSRLKSRDLSHIGLRCHRLEKLTISMNDEVAREDVVALLGGMQSEKLRRLTINATFDNLLFEMPFTEFSPALRNSVEEIEGDRATAPVILQNLKLNDFPLLKCVNIRSDLITDETIMVLAKFPQLTSLVLDCDEITDQGVIPILWHGTLEILFVSGRYITDKVPRLAIERCKSLRWLSIGWKYPVPNAGEILEMIHRVMDTRYGRDERPIGEHDPRIFQFRNNPNTFESKNMHPWVFVNH